MDISGPSMGFGHGLAVQVIFPSQSHLLLLMPRFQVSLSCQFGILLVMAQSLCVLVRSLFRFSIPAGMEFWVLLRILKALALWFPLSPPLLHLPVLELVCTCLPWTRFMSHPTGETLQWIMDSWGFVPTDAFGPLDEKSIVHAGLIVVPPVQQQKFDDSFTALDLVAAFAKLQCFWHGDSTHFTWTFEGPTYSLKVISGFWCDLLSVDFSHKLGYALTVQQSANTCTIACKLDLEAVKTGSSAVLPPPLHLICNHILVNAAHRAFAPLHRVGDLEVHIMVYGRQLWSGKIPSGLPLDFVMSLIDVISFPRMGTLNYRVLVHGKMKSFDDKLRDLQIENKPLRLFLQHPMWGGGYGNGSKGGYRAQLKNAMASTLLEEGFNLQWTSKSVGDVLQKMGTKGLGNLMSGSQMSRLQCAKQALADCGIDIPEVKPHLASQQAFKKKKPLPQPNPAGYRILPGILTNEDGMNTPFVPRFGPQVTGYHCVSIGDAQKWILMNEPLSKDELALIIFGTSSIATSLPTVKATLPCIDELDRRVLIACTLVQFGHKKVAIQSGGGHQVQTDETAMLALTTHKNDWSQQWEEIVSSTFKFFRSLPFLQDLIVSLWGRSFRQGKLTATAATCDSIQVHTLVPDNKLLQILKASGHNLIWVTPKDKDSRPDSTWRLIWLDDGLDFESASLACVKAPEAAGLVRIRSRFAIRVHKTHFENTWKTLFPNTPPPSQLQTNCVWKIESLPFGVTQKTLLEWSEHHSLKIHPMRSLGPRTWVVGVVGSPPDRQMHFNGCPLLIRELKPRQQDQHPIIAGPKTVPTAVENSRSLPPLLSDPWKDWKRPAAISQTAAPAIGPTEQKFAQQEDRISKLEEALGKQASSIESIQQDATRRDHEIRVHLDERLAGVKQELSQNLGAALQQQSKSFEQNFNELKTLLMQQQQQPKPKRKNPAEHEDMDDSWLFLGLSRAIVLCLWVFLLPSQFLARTCGIMNSPGSGFSPRWIRAFCFFSMLVQFASATSAVPCAFWLPSTGASCRFGEAKNPGPETTNEIRFCVTNPTCISKKFPVYSELMAKHKCQVISLSETAATATIQLKLSKQLRHLSCRAIWGPPVQPLCDTSSGFEHTRRKAAGVGLFSRLPVRPSRLQVDSSWALSTRFVHSILRVHEISVQIVVLYCKPSSRDDAKSFNDELMQFALSQIDRIPLPFVIMGDFNQPVVSFETLGFASGPGMQIR